MKFANTMTSAELAARRHDPLFVQTMCRPSNLDRSRLVYSDIEEFSAEALALQVSRMGPEWRRSGPPFVRNRPPTTEGPTP